MHLWPSLKVRNSFKHDYLITLDRISSERKERRQSQGAAANKLVPRNSLGPFAFCRQLLKIFTCSLCFGVFSDEDDIDCM